MKQVIKDYPNYEITTSGKVLSSYKKGELLVPRISKNGYYYVNLYNENGRKTKKIHRLVAETFIPNPDNLPQVNHKDGNKLNNHVDNLEWCDGSYNMQHANALGLVNHFTESHKRASVENGLSRGRKVKAMDVATGVVKTFDSVRTFEKALGVYRGAFSRAIEKGKCVKGYQVWYADTLATTMDEEP